MAAQQPATFSEPTATFKATSRLVVLDVVVTDNSGRPVPGLSKDDFSIFEDGQLQRITAFESPETHPAISAPARNAADRSIAATSQSPATIFVLDELNTTFQDMTFSRECLRRYLRQQPEELAGPRALYVINNTEFRVLQDFTRDRQLLLNAAQKHNPHYPWKMVRGFQVERLARSLEALQQIAFANMGNPGRKNVIWIGRGFPAVNLVGEHNRDKGVILDAVNRTISSLLQARVTLYPIDPTMNVTYTKTSAMEDDEGGLQGGPETFTDPFNSDVNLASFGPATGGRSFHSRNDVDAEIATGVEDGERYYTVAYVPSNRSDEDRFRRIRIKLRQPGLRARTREGYYQVEAPRTKDMLAIDLRQAAENALQYTGIPVVLTSLTGKGQISCRLSIDAHALDWQSMESGDSQAMVRIAVASIGPGNRILAYEVKEKASITKAADFKRLLDQPVTFPMDINVPAATKRVRFIVRDEASRKIGSAEINVE